MTALQFESRSCGVMSAILSHKSALVFISSTAKDLLKYREAAARAAKQAGFEAGMMEDFEAQSLKPPYQACMDKVRKCDVLVVIVAHRCGWSPQTSRVIMQRASRGSNAKRFSARERKYSHL